MIGKRRRDSTGMRHDPRPPWGRQNHQYPEGRTSKSLEESPTVEPDNFWWRLYRWPRREQEQKSGPVKVVYDRERNTGAIRPTLMS